MPTKTDLIPQRKLSVPTIASMQINQTLRECKIVMDRNGSIRTKQRCSSANAVINTQPRKIRKIAISPNSKTFDLKCRSENDSPVMRKLINTESKPVLSSSVFQGPNVSFLKLFIFHSGFCLI